MRALIQRILRLLRRRVCCRPPVAPTGVMVGGGGGSAELTVMWDPLPPADIAFYRVYRSKGNGFSWHLAVVDPSTFGIVAPGKMAVVDAPDYYPWPPIGIDDAATHCYRVSAVSRTGLEGPMSIEVCGTPATP